MFSRVDEQRGPVSAELAENGKVECFNQTEWQMAGEWRIISNPLCGNSYNDQHTNTAEELQEKGVAWHLQNSC